MILLTFSILMIANIVFLMNQSRGKEILYAQEYSQDLSLESDKVFTEEI